MRSKRIIRNIYINKEIDERLQQLTQNSKYNNLYLSSLVNSLLDNFFKLDRDKQLLFLQRNYTNKKANDKNKTCDIPMNIHFNFAIWQKYESFKNNINGLFLSIQLSKLTRILVDKFLQLEPARQDLFLEKYYIKNLIKKDKEEKVLAHEEVVL